VDDVTEKEECEEVRDDAVVEAPGLLGGDRDTGVVDGTTVGEFALVPRRSGSRIQTLNVAWRCCRDELSAMIIAGSPSKLSNGKCRGRP
jgi:hypothetical protein